MQRMAVLRVLLVDEDPWTFQTVKSVLSRRGHVVHQAADLEAAQTSLRLLLPDVVVCEPAGLPTASLLAFLRQVRIPDPALDSSLVAGGATLGAVVLLSTLPPDDEQLRLLPADAYLQKPFRFAELDAVLEQAVQRRRGVSHRSSGLSAPGLSVSGVHGSLSQLSLASLLTMIEMERKSGILLLRRGSQSARLYVRDGRVIAARLFAATTLTGIDVVYKLLTWTDGHFDFTSMPVSVPQELATRSLATSRPRGTSAADETATQSASSVDSEFDIPVTHLLLESARRRDESRTEPALPLPRS